MRCWPGRLGSHGQDRVFVAAGTHLARRKNGVGGDPVARLLVGLSRIGLEHYPFAWPPAARIHLVTEPNRKLLLVVMCIALRSEVDVALGQPQCAEILRDVVRVR